MKKERTVYFDYLRFFAIIAVIILHAASQDWGGLEGRSFVWNVFNIYDGITRWGVSVFVMISGALFLSRDIPTEKIYTKYIPRLVVSYFVWSAVYSLLAPDRYLAVDRLGELSFKDFFIQTVSGTFHLWFIPMIIGLYICIPVIRQIVKNEHITKYYLVLALIFSFAVPLITKLVADFSSGNFKAYATSVLTLITDMGIKTVVGFATLFVLGYYINRVELNERTRTVIYILGAVGFLATVLLNVAVAVKTNMPYSKYYDTFTLNVLFEAVAVFVWFRYKDYKNEKLNAVISQLSKYSFGAYLVHVLVMAVLNEFGVNAFTFNPIFCVPVLSLVTAVISFAISFLFNKIPVINKWII